MKEPPSDGTAFAPLCGPGGISSRSGLYRQFARKKALFRAAVGQELDAALQDASCALDMEGAGLERRLPVRGPRLEGRGLGLEAPADSEGGPAALA